MKIGKVLFIFIVTITNHLLFSQITSTYPKVEVTKLTEMIYKFESHPNANASVNFVVSIGEDGVVFVDGGHAEVNEKTKEAFEKLGAGTVKYIINTHLHDDHTGVNRICGDIAAVIAHKNISKHFNSDYYLINGFPKTAHPDILIDGNISLFFNGEEIKIYPFINSHTDCDIIVHFTKSGIVIIFSRLLQ